MQLTLGPPFLSPSQVFILVQTLIYSICSQFCRQTSEFSFSDCVNGFNWKNNVSLASFPFSADYDELNVSNRNDTRAR